MATLTHDRIAGSFGLQIARPVHLAIRKIE
jgi:hypothetical protein